MQFTTLFTLAAALAIATASFTVPADAVEGSYMVTRDANGNEVHTLLAARSDTPSVRARHYLADTSKSAKLPRQLNGGTVTCGGALDLNHADCDAANAELDDQCGGAAGSSVPANAHWYHVVGGVVAYYCNFGGTNRCDSVSRGQASLAISNQCGLYNSGYDNVNANALTYGYDENNVSFC